ncbi:MAG: hypothetical protein AAF694_30320 [Bacteroidota bacterium]
MRKSLILIITVLCSLIRPIALHAQPSPFYHPGYIFISPTDTIEGYIRYDTRSHFVKKVIFSKTETGPETSYSVDDIWGFQLFGGEVFWADSLSLPEEETQFLFAEVLVQGELSLLKVHKHFFVKKPNSPSVALKNPALSKEKGNLLEAIQYIGTLRYLMQDCRELVEKITPKLAYREVELKRIVAEYNECKGHEYRVNKQVFPFSRVRFEINAGAFFSQTKFKTTNGDNYFLGSADFNRDLSPLFGLGAEFPLQKFSNRLKFVLGLQFSSLEVHSAQIIKEPFHTTTRTFTHDVSISYNQLITHFGLHYHLFDIPIPVSLRGGFSYHFFLNHESSYIVEQVDPARDDSIRFDDIAFHDPRTRVSLWGEVSTLLHKIQKGGIGLRARYHIGYNLVKFTRVKLKVPQTVDAGNTDQNIALSLYYQF